MGNKRVREAKIWQKSSTGEQAGERLSVARVRLLPGDGNIIVNGRDFEEFFPNQAKRLLVNSPWYLPGWKVSLTW